MCLGKTTNSSQENSFNKRGLAKVDSVKGNYMPLAHSSFLEALDLKIDRPPDPVELCPIRANMSKERPDGAHMGLVDTRGTLPPLIFHVGTSSSSRNPFLTVWKVSSCAPTSFAQSHLTNVAPPTMAGKDNVHPR
jgi:hypothetical protein